jgi:hypothetical protein
MAITAKKQYCSRHDSGLDVSETNEDGVGLCTMHLSQLQKGRKVTVLFGLNTDEVNSVESFMAFVEEHYDAFKMWVDARADVVTRKVAAAINNNNDSEEETVTNNNPAEDYDPVVHGKIESRRVRNSEFKVLCEGRYYRSTKEYRLAKENRQIIPTRTVRERSDGYACQNCSGGWETVIDEETGKEKKVRVVVKHATMDEVRECSKRYWANRKANA